MNTAISVLLLLVTVLLSLVAGVGFGYYLILSILNAFNPHRTPKPPAPSFVVSAGN
jgi:hypothetical protein